MRHPLPGLAEKEIAMSKKTQILLVIGAAVLGMSGCAPVVVKKCITDRVLDEKGHKLSAYSECLTQVPDDAAPFINLRHPELKN